MYAILHLLALPVELVDHGKGFRAMLAAWMPDWREWERRPMAQATSGEGNHAKDGV